MGLEWFVHPIVPANVLPASRSSGMVRLGSRASGLSWALTCTLALAVMAVESTRRTTLVISCLVLIELRRLVRQRP